MAGDREPYLGLNPEALGDKTARGTRLEGWGMSSRFIALFVSVGFEYVGVSPYGRLGPRLLRRWRSSQRQA